MRIGAEIIINRSSASECIKKGEADYVTGTDALVQKTLKDELIKDFPNVNFLGEEQENHCIDKGELWILDPIDGTTNYMHNYMQSAISLAYVIDGVTEIGLIMQPYTNELFYAIKGEGAYLNGKPIHVSNIDNMEKSLISVGTCPYYHEYADEVFEKMKKVFLRCMDIRRSGSAALDMAYVACGRLEAYMEKNVKAWDYAAGMLIISEAGGKVFDVKGNIAELNIVSSLIATNGKIDNRVFL